MVDALTGAEPWSGNLDSRMYAAQSRQRAFEAHLDAVLTIAKHKREHPVAATGPSNWDELTQRARRSGAMQAGPQGPSARDPRVAADLNAMHVNVEAHVNFSQRTRRLKGLACTIAYAANPAALYQLAHAAVVKPRGAGLMIVVGGAKVRAPSERWMHSIGYAPWCDGGKRIIDAVSAQWVFEDGVANDTVARCIERYVARAGVKYWPGKADVLCVITYDALLVRVWNC